MEFTGKIEKIFESQQISDKFKKRDFVITDADSSQYPQSVLFQVTQDRVALLDKLKEGDVVTVFFNLRGRKSGDKYFNSLEAWKIQAQDLKPEKTMKDLEKEAKKPDFGDDLPF